MSEHHAAVDAVEQTDLDGDNDIDDMMDEEDPMEDDLEEDNFMKGRGEYAKDDSYKRAGGVYAEDDGYRKNRDQNLEEEDYRNIENESFTEEHGSEGEAPNKVVDVANEPSRSFSDEDGPVGLKDEEDSEKHVELLALPPHGLEVFIGGLPRDATEEDLRELYEPLGEIYEIREVNLAKDKDSKENKGFAFITFTIKDGAQKPVNEIHDKQFKGRTLRCSLSQTKYRLFIGNVPKNLTEEELRKILEDTGFGVENVECFKDPQNPSRNHGFLFVEYYNNACAEYSR